MAYLTRRLESKTDIASVSGGLTGFWTESLLAVQKNRGLLLKRTLGLKNIRVMVKSCRKEGKTLDIGEQSIFKVRLTFL